MSQLEIYLVVAWAVFVVLVAPTMLIGHLEFRWGRRREYPKNPGEPGIRYVLRTVGIMLYYGLIDWKNLVVGGTINLVGTVRWLIFGKNVEENNGE